MHVLEVTLTTSFTGLHFYSVDFSESEDPTALSLSDENSDFQWQIAGERVLKINIIHMCKTANTDDSVYL